LQFFGLISSKDGGRFMKEEVELTEQKIVYRKAILIIILILLITLVLSALISYIGAMVIK